MREAEKRGLAYLFKIRRTKTVLSLFRQYENSCERPASEAACAYQLKHFELKTKNRSRNNGSGQRFIASNGNSRHPTVWVKHIARKRLALFR